MINIKDDVFCVYDKNSAIGWYEIRASQAKAYIKNLNTDDKIVLLKVLANATTNCNIEQDLQTLQQQFTNEGKIVVVIEDE